MPDATVAVARGVTRREFLNYVWGAAMALFMTEMGGAIFLYALPRFKAGEFGAYNKADLESRAPKGTAQIDFTATDRRRGHLRQPQEGLLQPRAPRGDGRARRHRRSA